MQSMPKLPVMCDKGSDMRKYDAPPKYDEFDEPRAPESQVIVSGVAGLGR
jgi:hypothetical protein